MGFCFVPRSDRNVRDLGGISLWVAAQSNLHLWKSGRGGVFVANVVPGYAIARRPIGESLRPPPVLGSGLHTALATKNKGQQAKLAALFRP